jgi:Rrf2 family protein
MIYSTGCEYGIKALVRLAERGAPGQFFLLRELTDPDDLPIHFVAKVMQALVRAEILISAKGRGGGFAMVRPANRITLRDVVAAVDGNERLGRCILGFTECDDAHACSQHEDWIEIRGRIEAMWDTTTIQDLVTRNARARRPLPRFRAQRP